MMQKILWINIMMKLEFLLGFMDKELENKYGKRIICVTRLLQTQRWKNNGISAEDWIVKIDGACGNDKADQFSQGKNYTDFSERLEVLTGFFGERRKD